MNEFSWKYRSVSFIICSKGLYSLVSGFIFKPAFHLFVWKLNWIRSLQTFTCFAKFVMASLARYILLYCTYNWKWCYLLGISSKPNDSRLTVGSPCINIFNIMMDWQSGSVGLFRLQQWLHSFSFGCTHVTGFDSPYSGNTLSVIFLFILVRNCSKTVIGPFLG